jgi:hypothetical protein
MSLIFVTVFVRRFRLKDLPYSNIQAANILI